MSDILYENEGKHLDTIKWPFKRYQILLPEKNNVDAFAWLVASFVRMYNRKKKNPEFLYNDDIENVVKTTGRSRNEVLMLMIEFALENMEIRKN